MKSLKEKRFEIFWSKDKRVHNYLWVYEEKDVLEAFEQLKKYIDNSSEFRKDYPESYIAFMKTLHWVKERLEKTPELVDDEALLNTRTNKNEFNRWLIGEVFGK